MDRRSVLAGLAAIPASPALAHFDPGAGPADEAYWRTIAAQYDLPSGVIQLENGNFGAMARPVWQAYGRALERVNRDTSLYARRTFDPDLARIRGRVAATLGVGADEIAFTRGATEALMALITGYNRLRAGDQVLFADLDYDSTQAAVTWLQGHRGVQAVKISLPEPATRQNLIDAYDQALSRQPRVRMMLLTQVSHRTGLVVPVGDIIEVARHRGVDVIVDSAHAWGQLDFHLPDLKADFVGLTAQKWIGAPLGVGLLYIRREHIGAIDTAAGAEADADHPIDQRVHTGTTNLAGFLALDAALDFQEAIGIAAKERRLRHLRDLWAERLRDHPGIDILTPSDARLTCAISSFRLRGRTGADQNRALAALLLERFGIFTVERSGVASGGCVRVTPGAFTSEADIDALIAALKALA